MENHLLNALADLLMEAGRDRAADVIYAAIEAETVQHAAVVPTPPRAALRLVHSNRNLQSPDD